MAPRSAETQLERQEVGEAQYSCLQEESQQVLLGRSCEQLCV